MNQPVTPSQWIWQRAEEYYKRENKGVELVGRPAKPIHILLAILDYLDEQSVELTKMSRLITENTTKPKGKKK